MRVEHTRQNVFTVVATSQELSALIAAARMSLEIMRGSPEAAPRDAVDELERVLQDFDSARARMTDPGGPAG
jgi:hypothetical protein